MSDPSNPIPGGRHGPRRQLPPERDQALAPTVSDQRQLVPSKSESPSDPAVASAELIRLFNQAQDPGALLLSFAEGMSSLHGELRDLGQRLLVAYASGDWRSYARTLRQLLDKYIRTIDVAGSLAAERTEAEQLRDLLRYALGNTMEILLQRSPQLKREATALAAALHHWRSGHELLPLEQRLRELTHRIGLCADDAIEQHNLLLGLFDLLLENVGELLDDRTWIQGQIDVVRDLIAGPLDAEAIERTRDRLRQMIYKQGLLKQGIVDCKQAMREMMLSFISRLDRMAASTGQYHQRVAGYVQAIEQTRGITDLGRLLQDVLQDTEAMQAQALGARDELRSMRQQVEQSERRISELEQELKGMSERLSADPLTGALNRRGFEELFHRELARTHRSGQPLCLALLDLDDFRQINQTHGHAGGDAALKHLVTVTHTVLRATDAIARLGGEEFVLLLPDATLFEATAAVGRLQRELLQRSLTYETVRMSISFSAGVTICRPQEDQEMTLKRADHAMYAAKRAGKNRVVSAD